MGMFDTFYGTYTCPKCGKSVDFEEQSKGFNKRYPRRYRYRQNPRIC